MSNRNNDDLILTIGEIKEFLEGHKYLTIAGEREVMEELETEAQKKINDKDRLSKIIVGLIK